MCEKATGTVIPVSKEVRQRLRMLKAREGVTYDGILRQLLEGSS